MKKAMVWLLSLMLVLSAAGVWAEEEETVFEQMSRMEWSFLSGVGGWSTDLHVAADGSFTGEFHDGELGETGENYPNGTIITQQYYCADYDGDKAIDAFDLFYLDKRINNIA